ncbi:hypothetical protein [Agromyces seonyuensis]|uniref:Uncharacterized protein n=1 Tax=Agromyces seonyuensis TaxID=2662446 RepID=A0A6I4NT59_9MICO|nr:hypothetical protein [Agromyces seonyuensis]MWB97646.1 hypothetical protein [Agromyces seonyuensis]
MTSAFHRRRDSDAPLTRRMVSRLHPALTDVLNRLEGSPLRQSFTDRAVEVSTSKAFADPVDTAAALTAHRWLLERADGDGIPLTAAGYLRPADVQALAAVLPSMQDWIFAVHREIDAHPVLDFREHLRDIGLLRKFKGTLRLTRLGRAGLADGAALWQHLADQLVPAEAGFAADAAVVVLVHAATTPGGKLDVAVVAKTLTALGWSHRDGTPVAQGEVFGVWNDLWVAVGNVGERAGDRRSDRTLSDTARILVHDALFEEMPGEGAR